MNKEHMKRFKSIVTGLLTLLLVCCATEDTQTVARFTQEVILDEFNTDGTPDSDIWGFEIGTGENGYFDGTEKANKAVYYNI